MQPCPNKKQAARFHAGLLVVVLCVWVRPSLAQTSTLTPTASPTSSPTYNYTVFSCGTFHCDCAGTLGNPKGEMGLHDPKWWSNRFLLPINPPRST